MNSRFSLIALAALPLSLGLVAAQTQQAQPTSPHLSTQSGQSVPNQTAPQGSQTQGSQTPGTQTPRSGTNYADVFVQKLAAQLGVTAERLKAAALAAGSATIDQGVQAGDLPSDHAAALKGRLAQHPLGFSPLGSGRGGFGGPGGGRGGHGHGPHGDRDGRRGFGPGSDPSTDRGADFGAQTGLGQGAASDTLYDLR